MTRLSCKLVHCYPRTEFQISYSMGDCNETLPDPVKTRLEKERRMYRHFKKEKSLGSASKPRKSYKEKNNLQVVNKRQLKRCPLCSSQNKQMQRHIRTIHSDVSGDLLKHAESLAKIRMLKTTPAKQKQKAACTICGIHRLNMKSHMVHAHAIPNKSAILKEYLPNSLIRKVNTENPKVEEWIKRYDRVYFNRMDGACLSIKESTRKKTTAAKLSIVANMLDFLTPRATDSTLNGAIKVVEELFIQPGGYAWTRKGKYTTLVRDLDYFDEFLGYALRDRLIDERVGTDAKVRVKAARKNAQKRANVEMAAFQDADREIVVVQADINAFHSSERARAARTALSGSQVIESQTVSINIRNYLIACLLIDNSCRPSAIEKMMVHQVLKAKENPKQDHKDGGKYYSVTTISSKNASASGLPTYLLITEKTMDMLTTYLERVRPNLVTEDSPDEVFLSRQGFGLNHTNISRAYRTIWLSVKDPNFTRKANSRHLRHSTNGLAKLCGDANLKESIHIALNHSPQSNEKSYLSQIRPHVTLQAKRKILALRESKSAEFAAKMRGSSSVPVKEVNEQKSRSTVPPTTSKSAKFAAKKREHPDPVTLVNGTTGQKGDVPPLRARPSRVCGKPERLDCNYLLV